MRKVRSGGKEVSLKTKKNLRRLNLDSKKKVWCPLFLTLVFLFFMSSCFFLWLHDHASPSHHVTSLLFTQQKDGKRCGSIYFFVIDESLTIPISARSFKDNAPFKTMYFSSPASCPTAFKIEFETFAGNADKLILLIIYFFSHIKNSPQITQIYIYFKKIKKINIICGFKFFCHVFVLCKSVAIIHFAVSRGRDEKRESRGKMRCSQILEKPQFFFSSCFLHLFL